MITYYCTNCEIKIVAKPNLKIKCKCGNQMYIKQGKTAVKGFKSRKEGVSGKNGS